MVMCQNIENCQVSTDGDFAVASDFKSFEGTIMPAGLSHLFLIVLSHYLALNFCLKLSKSRIPVFGLLLSSLTAHELLNYVCCVSLSLYNLCPNQYQMGQSISNHQLSLYKGASNDCAAIANCKDTFAHLKVGCLHQC